jgi:uncharacterized protein YrzB (UPF0473 family)
MVYNMEVQNKGDYLHFIVTGQNTRENVINYLKEVFEICNEKKIYNILIEENLMGKSLSIVDIFNIVDKGSERMKNAFLQIAYLDTNEEHDLNLLKFAETVALNRQVFVRLFSDLFNAENWLKDTITKQKKHK